MIGRRLYQYLLVFFSVIAIDQLTKMWALTTCAHRSLYVTSFLSCSVAYNRGIAWSLASSNIPLIFMFVTALVFMLTALIASIGYKRYRAGKNAWGECLIVAGSIGNLCDRFMIGSVIDFIELSYKDWSWPIFNAADIAIVVGVGIMFFVNYRETV